VVLCYASFALRKTTYVHSFGPIAIFFLPNTSATGRLPALASEGVGRDRRQRSSGANSGVLALPELRWSLFGLQNSIPPRHPMSRLGASLGCYSLSCHNPRAASRFLAISNFQRAVSGVRRQAAAISRQLPAFTLFILYPFAFILLFIVYHSSLSIISLSRVERYTRLTGAKGRLENGALPGAQFALSLADTRERIPQPLSRLRVWNDTDGAKGRRAFFFLRELLVFFLATASDLLMIVSMS
jgi:hypothetical protein